MAHLIDVRDVFKDYLLGTQKVEALKGVSIQVESGEFLAISGSSGSGKTTLLNLLGCIDTPTRGQIVFEGEDVQSRSSVELAGLRARKIGYIFQTFNLLPVLTALENVEYPLLLLNFSKKERLKMSEAALEQTGLGRFGHHRPAELSGGQRQRVAIARALVKSPRIVLADEPTANLDSKTANEILDIMNDLNRATRVTFVFSSHDPNVLKRAGRVIPMQSGSLHVV